MSGYLPKRGIRCCQEKYIANARLAVNSMLREKLGDRICFIKNHKVFLTLFFELNCPTTANLE